MAKKNNKKASKNREKKLAKRKNMQKIKKKKVNRENSSISFKNIIKEVHKYPVLRSFIGDTLFHEANMGAVVLAYRLPANKVAFLSLLVDLMGAGVKDVHFKIFTEDEYYSHIELLENNMELINSKPECLKFIISQAVKKSKRFGIEQHYDFEKYFNYFYGHFDESNCNQDFEINQDEFFTQISEEQFNKLGLSEGDILSEEQFNEFDLREEKQ